MPVIVEFVGGDLETNDPQRLILQAPYGSKGTRIILEGVVVESTKETGDEAVRRELIGLIKVLQEAVASPKGILWPSRRN
jgi:hypothetical protein